MSDFEYEWKYVPGHDECENLEGYCVGGYHPVEIGDQFCDGKYIIVHKLGAGTAATVWLAQATYGDHKKQYVAMKILTADNSQDDCNELRLQEHLQSQAAARQRLSSVSVLLDSFWIEGPNGKHLCLTFEAAGPSISMLRRSEKKIRPDVMRSLALQMAEGLKELHDAGVISGDLSSNNLLLRLVDINSWTVEELHERLGHPIAVEIETAKGEPLDEHAPKAAYLPCRFNKDNNVFDFFNADLLKPEIVFVDLAEGRLTSETPADHATGWSIEYAAPETLWFAEMQDQMSDVWALACIWYEMRTSTKLFEDSHRGPEGIQNNIVETIGAIPESWHDRLPPPEEVQDEDQDEVPAYEAEPAEQLVSENENAQSIRTIKLKLRQAWDCVLSLFRQQPETLSDPESAPADAEMEDVDQYYPDEELAQIDESLKTKIARIGNWPEWFTLTLEQRVTRKQEYNMEEFGHITTADVDDEPPPAPLSDEEKVDFEDILSSMLKYEKSDRAPLERVVGHPWFKNSYGKVEDVVWLKEYKRGWKPRKFIQL